MYSEILVEHNYRFQVYIQKLTASLLLFNFLSPFLLFGTVKDFPTKKKGSMNIQPTLCIICPCCICAIKFYYICLPTPTKFYSGFLDETGWQKSTKGDDPELSSWFLFPSGQYTRVRIGHTEELAWSFC